ncbi:GIY-YIG nuclease family protein [Amycolatopsis taiwanensis]|uniref:GIY-YIG nuclease family protein n=1 Tax=Amycolatopsis taiwanensis TaxID=342230 RepID=UPI00048746F2|nr:GIY-YIG nuclease family protein [Amycolatopsis taiwanensis]
MTNNHAWEATLQHLQLIVAKRDKLEHAQREAEDQLIHALARDFNARRIGWAELNRVYTTLRGQGKQPGFLPGFTGKRWAAVLPNIQAVRARAAEAEEAKRQLPEVWLGTFPYSDPDLPPFGICVVYVLYDASGKPCYVGSTKAFANRMKAHARDGKRWSTWHAYKCRDRGHAYEVEGRFLDQFKPYLNKRATP